MQNAGTGGGQPHPWNSGDELVFPILVILFFFFSLKEQSVPRKAVGTALWMKRRELSLAGRSLIALLVFSHTQHGRAREHTQDR